VQLPRQLLDKSKAIMNTPIFYEGGLIMGY
jgi:hypothetical protein